MCAGSHLANRELYTAFIRLITAFTVHLPKNTADYPILDALECNAIPTALTTDPKPFKVGLKPRDPVLLEKWIAASQERTKDLWMYSLTPEYEEMYMYDFTRNLQWYWLFLMLGNGLTWPKYISNYSWRLWSRIWFTIQLHPYSPKPDYRPRSKLIAYLGNWS